MADTIKVRIVARCMLNATEVGEPGDIVTLDVPQAANMLAGGHVAVDPEAAREAIAAWNALALRIEKQSQPRAPVVPFAMQGGRFH